MNGIVIVDKPSGWTSQDVVSKLRGVFKKLHTPGGSAHKHRQNTGGHRIQRAAVADPAGFEHTPQLGYHILTGPA